MKRRILSAVMALALCVGFLPAPARAAGTTLTKPLDFTRVGDGEGKTPAEGPGYKLTGDSGGYTLILDGLSLNATEYDDTSYWGQGQQPRTAILLPNDGPVTVELRGTNTISASSQWNDEHAIAISAPFPVTLEGSGKLVTNVHSAVVASTGDNPAGNIIIKDVTIVANQKGGGIWCRSGSISIENANLTIYAQGDSAAAIDAAKNITITNSNLTVSCDEYYAIIASGDVTITGGKVTASCAEDKTGAIVAIQNLTIEDGADITATATGAIGYGIYSGEAMTLSRSDISAKGATAAVRFIDSLTLKGIAILEPSDGKIGTNVIANSDDTNATSAKLAPVTLNVPASPLTCTYGDPSVSVTLTTTPQVTSAVEIYNGGTRLGAGNLGEAIAIDTSALPAGDITLTAKLPNELGEKDFTVAVKPKPVTVTGAAATGRAYDGTREVAITAVTLDGVLESDKGNVSVNTANLKGTISGADVGSYDSVTLPEMTLTGAKAGNYTLTQPTGAVTASVAISKAEYKGGKTAVSSAKFGAAGSCDLTALLQGISGAAAGAPTASGDIFDGTPTVNGKTLSYMLADVDAGKSGTITVPVTSTNYEDFNLTVTVTVTDKFVPILTVSPITVEYTGEAVPDSAIRGTAAVNGQAIPGTWSFAAGQSLTTVADSGAKTVKFTPDEAHADDYAAVEGMVAVTISKANPKGAPTYTTISASGKTLADAALTSPEGWPAGTLSWKLPTDTAVTSNTEYEWVFTPDDTDNYNIITGKIKLWSYVAPGNPGGSSGSSGSSGASTLPVTTTGQNNSAVTTTTTAVPSASTSGGTATAAVDTSMGSEIVRQAVNNNSENVVIAPQVTGDVSKTKVSIPASTVGQIGSRTSANLTVSTPVADITIPNGGLGSLASAGGTITVTAEQTGSTVALTVTSGGRSVDSIPGGLTLTVPAADTAPGTVAILICEDGTREVVRKSIAGERSVTIPLDGSARLEIADNSKRFADVPATSWAADAVAFVSARELFSGTGPDRFSPDQPMSRGMLAAVLHNLENNPAQVLTGAFLDVDDSQWYAKGVAWAEAKGIISGYGDGRFGPNDNITREQLAVMLWRYAGSPAAVSQELRFADADKAGGWALDALRWATESGILRGKGNGILDPAGQATRAEAAQMLKNFMERQ